MRSSGRVLLAACVLAVAGCGGADSSLDRTAANLEDIRSGVLHVEAGIAPSGSGEPFSYELSGPFEFPKGDGFASADLRYRQVHGDASEDARLVARAGAGWIEVDGERRDLSQDELRGLAVSGEEGTFLDDLDLERWFVRWSERERGDGTIEISGEANVGRALEGLIGLGGGFGGEVPAELDEEAQERIAGITRSSELRIVTGADDHLLRTLRYELELGFDVAQELQETLGTLEGATLSFELTIRSPNEPVAIGG